MPASSTVTAVVTNLTHSATNVSLGVLVLAGLFILFFLYGLVFGKGRVLAFLFSLYPAILIARAFPFGGAFTVAASPASQKLAVFGVALLVSVFLLRNLFISDFPFSRLKRWFEAALLSVCTVSLGLSSIYQLTMPEGIAFLSAFFHTLEPSIASPFISFFILLAPIVAALIYGQRSFY